MLPIRTILHPTDFSKHADDALQFAGSLARDYGSRLIVLHVLQGAEPPEWLRERMAGAFPWTEDASRALEQRLRRLREANPGLQAEARVADGIAAREILREASSGQCDLIVMGTHGWRGQQVALTGSVAEAVMREANCPVLTVRNPPTAASRELGPVVVDRVACSTCSVPTTRVHHRDFPEIRAECGSPADAARHLSGQLERARDNVGGDWHREAVDRAIADVAEFLASEPAPDLTPSCRCKPADSLTPTEARPGLDESRPSQQESIPC